LTLQNGGVAAMMSTGAENSETPEEASGGDKAEALDWFTDDGSGDLDASLRVPVERDHGFRWKMITQSGGT
jgi:hypothetical protein